MIIGIMVHLGTMTDVKLLWDTVTYISQFSDFVLYFKNCFIDLNNY